MATFSNFCKLPMPHSPVEKEVSKIISLKSLNHYKILWIRVRSIKRNTGGKH